jgi:hypothetical protein
VLVISVPELTQAAVGHLINMKKLHTLHLLDHMIGVDQNPTFAHYHHHKPHIIVTVAGEVPSLQNLDWSVSRGCRNDNQFIEEFGQRYPQKQLLVNHLRYVLGLLVVPNYKKCD